MKKLYEKSYFDHRKYLLEEFENFDLRNEEFLAVMLIDYYNEVRIPVDIPMLSKKMKMDCEAVDFILNTLVAKGYLEISFVEKQVVYSLAGLFCLNAEHEVVHRDAYQSLFDVYEDGFGRSLSPNEYMQLKDWMSEYEVDLIHYALKEAIVYEKKTFAYIEAILKAWKTKNFSAKAYRKGERL
ncbi:MAG: DnaD domain-containing protein [Breznakia sp.]